MRLEIVAARFPHLCRLLEHGECPPFARFLRIGDGPWVLEVCLEVKPSGRRRIVAYIARVASGIGGQRHVATPGINSPCSLRRAINVAAATVVRAPSSALAPRDGAKAFSPPRGFSGSTVSGVIAQHSAEKLRRHLVQIQPPVIPGMAARAFPGFNLHSLRLELIDDGQAIRSRDVGFSPAPPEQLER